MEGSLRNGGEFPESSQDVCPCTNDMRRIRGLFQHTVPAAHAGKHKNILPRRFIKRTCSKDAVL